jgi:H+/Cl- antiporter ClcA
MQKNGFLHDISHLGFFRRASVFVASPRLWRAHVVFWLGALATGVISVAFAHLSDMGEQVFFGVTHGGWQRWLPLVLTPAGMIFCGLMARKYFPGTQGSGIPQAIAAHHMRNEAGRSLLLSARIIIGKIALTVIALACGASVGREGPTIQVGAAMMLVSARLGRMAHTQGVILAGSAAGIAAAFNTPLAGIVFAIEEMGRTYSARITGVVLSTVILAGVAALGLEGSYTYFGVSSAMAHFPQDWPLVLSCGILGGVLGAIFARLLLEMTYRIRRWHLPPVRKIVVIAGSAGLIVAVVGIATGGMTFGAGYAESRAGIEGASLPWYFFVGKFVATLASAASGIPGGIFAPSLTVGVGFGSVMAAVWGSSAGLGAILGMAGYFAGLTQAPMTAIVIIVEMTGSHEHIVPIMAAALLASGTSRLIEPEPLYHALSRLWTADTLKAIGEAPETSVTSKG